MDISLNDKQTEAVLHDDGPLLILAGAGSGKTRVITTRIARLINDGVNPYNILAITFTNKAADEMRNRVDETTDYKGNAVWVSTFHSFCVRVLRRFIDRLGYSTSFSIYDTDDQKALIKSIIKRENLDPKSWKEKMFLFHISSAKNQMISPRDFKINNDGDFKLEIVAKIYEEYENEMRKSNALDFDDLLLKTVELFKKHEDVLNNYQERFKYIMVDEYQDTNTVQFKLINLLANKYKNICVVGDDDQSIYKFRGADIRNILEFENHFPGTKVIKLEENYRSTPEILNTANIVIANNIGRKSKKLWTGNNSGAKPQFICYPTGVAEAEGVVKDIIKNINSKGVTYKDFAILYRTNAQSRIFEEKLIYENIPYRLIGGVNFYARREIKDLLAYLHVLINNSDDISLRRIVNVPKRGIGDTTVSHIIEYGFMNDKSLWDSLLSVNEIPSVGRAQSKIKDFMDMMVKLKIESLNSKSILDILDNVIKATDYIELLKLEGTDEAKSRIENIEELRSKALTFDNDNKDNDIDNPLAKFLEEVSLVADIDNLSDSENRVVLMTLHGSKGLEFPYVYMCGMEEGLFPSYMSINSGDPSDIEEERRLCYVGITRAKKRLMLCAASSRMLRGEIQYNTISRFIDEIPDGYIDIEIKEQQEPYQKNYSRGYSNNNSYGINSTFNESKPTPKKYDFAKISKGASLYNDAKTDLDYNVGDKVSHIKFGEGVVTSIEDGGRDFKVSVDFDDGSSRTMFASFAKLEKVD